MPRSNRPRSRRSKGDDPEAGEFDIARMMSGWRRTEVRKGGTWNVQPVSGAQAVKTYVCPGCGLDIPPGTSHLVTWRADGLLGDAADLEARRHWHSHCWRIGTGEGL